MAAMSQGCVTERLGGVRLHAPAGGPQTRPLARRHDLADLRGGGAPVGRELARRLGAEFLDRNIVAMAAQRAGISEEEARGYDERMPGVWQRVATVLHGEFARRPCRKPRTLPGSGRRSGSRT